jgi:hypothetical protein
MSSGVQIVTDLAGQITRLFDSVGASLIERHAALDVARALVIVSEASISAPSGESPTVLCRPEAASTHE